MPQGDDVRTTDWNVTARVGRSFVKIFDSGNSPSCGSSGSCSTANQRASDIHLLGAGVSGPRHPPAWSRIPDLRLHGQRLRMRSAAPGATSRCDRHQPRRSPRAPDAVGGTADPPRCRTGELVVLDSGSSKFREAFENAGTREANQRTRTFRKLGIDEVAIDSQFLRTAPRPLFSDPPPAGPLRP